MTRNAAFVAGLLLALVQPCDAQSLRGSHRSMVLQQRVARRNDLTFLRTPAALHRLAQAGRLVRVSPGRFYRLDGVSYPYAREELRTFVRRLAVQYHGACGLPLVVTSLTRPISRQPTNASALSVHPTGMAVDLRRSGRAACRRWLESTLLALEGEGVIEATSEHHPAHYHVAVFPRRYSAWVLQVRASSPEDAAGSPDGS